MKNFLLILSCLCYIQASAQPPEIYFEDGSLVADTSITVLMDTSLSVNLKDYEIWQKSHEDLINIIKEQLKYNDIIAHEMGIDDFYFYFIFHQKEDSFTCRTEMINVKQLQRTPWPVRDNMVLFNSISSFLRANFPEEEDIVLIFPVYFKVRDSNKNDVPGFKRSKYTYCAQDSITVEKGFFTVNISEVAYSPGGNPPPPPPRSNTRITNEKHKCIFRFLGLNFLCKH